MAEFSLHLAKEDFKFSSGHFTLFGDDRAERLHGHNYRVEVELGGPAVDRDGLLVSFPHVKGLIRAACARLDSRTLIPTESHRLEVTATGDHVDVVFRHRRYRFPAADVVLLPVANTSIELLAEMLWRELAAALEEPLVETLGVRVAETAGQGCWYRAPLPDKISGL